MKVHFLCDGVAGLFEHKITACGAAGDVERSVLEHYSSRSLFVVTEDRSKVTCKTCLNQLDMAIAARGQYPTGGDPTRLQEAAGASPAMSANFI
jgi:hypothetical protein